MHDFSALLHVITLSYAQPPLWALLICPVYSTCWEPSLMPGLCYISNHTLNIPDCLINFNIMNIKCNSFQLKKNLCFYTESVNATFKVVITAIQHYPHPPPEKEGITQQNAHTSENNLFVQLMKNTSVALKQKRTINRYAWQVYVFCNYQVTVQCKKTIYK